MANGWLSCILPPRQLKANRCEVTRAEDGRRSDAACPGLSSDRNRCLRRHGSAIEYGSLTHLSPVVHLIIWRISITLFSVHLQTGGNSKVRQRTLPEREHTSNGAVDSSDNQNCPVWRRQPHMGMPALGV